MSNIEQLAQSEHAAWMRMEDAKTARNRLENRIDELREEWQDALAALNAARTQTILEHPLTK